ncbi:MAG: beta-ribofuranosylaminobenzene 5'-phosphate synthase family protein [Acidobacteriota bacterium]
MPRVTVKASARLHFGLMNVRPGKGVRFGSLGLAIEGPAWVLEAEPSDDLEVEGMQAERVRRVAAAFLDTSRLRGGARIRVRQAIPDHVGLGSGTQMSLAVAAALSRLHDRPEDVYGWCNSLGRGRRSGIGVHAFRFGGFLLDAGHAEGRPSPPPLIFRQPFPEEWGIIAAIPREGRGVSGHEEERIFSKQPDPSEALLEHLSGMILMRLLPALLERDLKMFGASLEKIQDAVGAVFREAQGDLYHSQAEPLVRWLRQAGAHGVGQSSWGPCVYALTPDPASAQDLAERLLEDGPSGARYDVRLLRPRNHGAEVDLNPCP